MNSYIELEARCKALQRALTRQRESFERQRPLCANHRDKQRGESCLACEIEHLNKRIKNMRHYTDEEK